MPIYEFQCQACGTVIEVLQKVSDPHITDCEACGKAEMKKKVTAAAFRLSGAGWYETDFKEGDKKKNLTETKSETKDQSAGDSAKSGEATKSAEPSKSPEGSKTSKEGSDKSTDKSSDKTSTKTDSTSSSIKSKDSTTD